GGENTDEITPTQLRERWAACTLRLIDVREPHEWEICHLEGAELIPLREVTSRMNELETSQDIVLYCKMGGRSLKALHTLRDAGFTRIKSLAGGINAWSRDIDPSVPEY